MAINKLIKQRLKAALNMDKLKMEIEVACKNGNHKIVYEFIYTKFVLKID